MQDPQACSAQPSLAEVSKLGSKASEDFEIFRRPDLLDAGNLRQLFGMASEDYEIFQRHDLVDDARSLCQPRKRRDGNAERFGPQKKIDRWLELEKAVVLDHIRPIRAPRN